MREVIRTIFEDNYRCYGYRRIDSALRLGGMRVSEKVVRRLMAQERLVIENTAPPALLGVCWRPDTSGPESAESRLSRVGAEYEMVDRSDGNTHSGREGLRLADRRLLRWAGGGFGISAPARMRTGQYHAGSRGTDTATR